MSETTERALLSVREAAALAGLSRTVAYRLAALDRLPGLVKWPGFQLLVRRRVLEAWLAGADPPPADGRPPIGDGRRFP
jgi:hypothetical protein